MLMSALCRLSHSNPFHPQDPEIGVKHTACHNPVIEANGLAAMGEWIQFEVTSTNTGSIEIVITTISNEMFKNVHGEWRYHIISVLE